MSGLGDDDSVKRVSRPVERQRCANNCGKGLRASFQSDVTSQTVPYRESVAVDTGDFMKISQFQLHHR